MDINCENVVGEEIKDRTKNTDDGKLVWDDSNLEAFIICMEEEVRAENRNSTTFTAIGWKNVLKALTVRTGKKYTMKQLKSKFNHVRVEYKTFVSLLAETGAGYNVETGMVIVEKERWDKLIKVNAYYSKYRKKPCNYFDKFTTIFGGTNATGVHVHTFYSSPILNQAPAHHEGIHTSFDLNDDFVELGGHEFSHSPEPRGKKPKRERVLPPQWIVSWRK
ncbi:uncharacterized protein LOC132302777 [Cornus florida]|uniref:uncharacterized protein LOC132302777 n=1 Tax=Cornus florida TaxID=4283 RepID=UPI00289D0C89|nr:uncharacterized protein LOC132302777 [Cornus florida]